MRVCLGCKEAKPLDAYYTYVRSSGTLNTLPRCKPCHSAHTDAARLAKYGGRRQARWYETWGLTEEAYSAMLTAQGGVCAICQRPPQEGKALDVDHDHACCSGKRSCGKCVRGLLCRSCNSALHVVERPDRHQRALAYLGRTP